MSVKNTRGKQEKQPNWRHSQRKRQQKCEGGIRRDKKAKPPREEKMKGIEGRRQQCAQKERKGGDRIKKCLPALIILVVLAVLNIGLPQHRLASWPCNSWRGSGTGSSMRQVHINIACLCPDDHETQREERGKTERIRRTAKWRRKEKDRKGRQEKEKEAR